MLFFSKLETRMERLELLPLEVGYEDPVGTGQSQDPVPWLNLQFLPNLLVQNYTVSIVNSQYGHLQRLPTIKSSIPHLRVLAPPIGKPPQRRALGRAFRRLSPFWPPR